MTELLRRGRLPQRWAKLTNGPSVTAKFAPERALAVHAQRAHGYRTGWSKRIDASCFCPACKAIFDTRLQVLNHVSGRDSPGASEEALPAGTDASAPAARTSATSQDGKARPGGISRL